MNNATAARLRLLGYPQQEEEGPQPEEPFSPFGPWSFSGGRLEKTPPSRISLEECRRVIHWLEHERALILDPSERDWLDADTASDIWEKNLALYLRILGMTVDENARASDVLAENFDDVVGRLLEESWVASRDEVKIEEQSTTNADPAIPPDVMQRAKDLIGLDHNSPPLTRNEILQIFKKAEEEAQHAPPTEIDAQDETAVESATGETYTSPGENKSPGGKKSRGNLKISPGEQACLNVCQGKLREIQRLINQGLSGMQEVTVSIRTDVRQARTGV